MESFWSSVFGTLGWYLSKAASGEVSKLGLLIPLVTMVVGAGVASWYGSRDPGTDVAWAEARCSLLDEAQGERAVEIASASTQAVRFVTSSQRTLRWALQPYGERGTCSEVPNLSGQAQSSALSCQDQVQFDVPAPPGNVIDQSSRESCMPGGIYHTVYVILDDGSVWYWDDYYAPSSHEPQVFMIVGGGLGLMLGVGVLWAWVNGFAKTDEDILRGVDIEALSK